MPKLACLLLLLAPAARAQVEAPTRSQTYLVTTVKELPPEARKVSEEFDEAAAQVRREADAKVDALRAKAVPRLKALQDEYTRAAKLDDALSIREEIRRVRGILPDPGTLQARADDIGRTWYFEVLGDAAGQVWGSGPYTGDSQLAAAAVHAGVLKAGERGVVKVTALPGRKAYEGSERNGVTTQPWGQWDVSFGVEKAGF